MRVHAYILTYNESLIIGYTLRHYLTFCDKVFIYDNQSSDNTREICKSFGKRVEIITVDTKNKISDHKYLDIKNHEWKRSNADWVIVCDADEILYYPRLPTILLKAKKAGYTIFKTEGFNIYSDSKPTIDGQIYWELNEGVPAEQYSKKIIFSPTLKAINYDFGCHKCNPVGNVNYAPEVLKVLHYKNIGGPEYVFKRHQHFNRRLSEMNQRYKLGSHYGYSLETIKKEFEACNSIKTRLI